MNKLDFLYKFHFKRYPARDFNFSLFFPFIGTILGFITVALTLSIMEGMEQTIFDKLKNISFPVKISNIHSQYFDEVLSHVINEGMEYSKGIEDRVLILKDDNYRLVDIHGVDNFNSFSLNNFTNNIELLNNDSEDSFVYIGKSLAIKLNIVLGDFITIITPGHLNLLTGLPYKKEMLVSGIYDIEILDYDQKHIFTNYTSIEELISLDNSLIYLNHMPSENYRSLIFDKFPLIKIEAWYKDHSSFISAMRIEKISYALIGFLIIAISGFTLMSMMSLSVMQMVSQIGILRALGTSKNAITLIFLIQGLITWVISSICGIIITLFIMIFNEKYDFIGKLFESSLFIDFPLILQINHIFLILIFSFILLIISAIYPALKASKINIINALGHNR